MNIQGIPTSTLFIRGKFDPSFVENGGVSCRFVSAENRQVVTALGSLPGGLASVSAALLSADNWTPLLTLTPLPISRISIEAALLSAVNWSGIRPLDSFGGDQARISAALVSAENNLVLTSAPSQSAAAMVAANLISVFVA